MAIVTPYVHQITPRSTVAEFSLSLAFYLLSYNLATFNFSIHEVAAGRLSDLYLEPQKVLNTIRIRVVL